MSSMCRGVPSTLILFLELTAVTTPFFHVVVHLTFGGLTQTSSPILTSPDSPHHLQVDWNAVLAIHNYTQRAVAPIQDPHRNVE